MDKSSSKFGKGGWDMRHIIITATAVVCLAVIVIYVIYGHARFGGFAGSLLKRPSTTPRIVLRKPLDFPDAPPFAEESGIFAKIDFAVTAVEEEPLLYLAHAARLVDPAAPGGAVFETPDYGMLAGSPCDFSGMLVKFDCIYVSTCDYPLPGGNRTGLDRLYLSLVLTRFGRNALFVMSAEHPAWSGLWENDSCVVAGYSYKVVRFPEPETTAPVILASRLVKPLLPRLPCCRGRPTVGRVILTLFRS